MGFSSARYDRKPTERRWKVHPIWRGIGCVLLLFVPFLSFIIARFFMASVKILPLPVELLKPVIFSYNGTDSIDRILYRINDFLNGRLLYGELFFTIIFMVLGFGLLSIIYGVLYRLFGPPRYGPLDAPPMKRDNRRRY
jgi:hypothetical protein